MYTKSFDQISKADVVEVGGKGASLGEMTSVGIPVPSGFVITTKTYKQFHNQEIPVDVKEEILKAFDDLGADRVAVRSSAVAEDSTSASWAGQMESYLNVKKEDLIDAVRKCWSSIHSERALSYASQQDLSEDKLLVAVVIQKMIESESSGVMFTINPVTKNFDEIMIEGCFGLGELLVQGMITPDNFLVDKNTFEILEKDIQIKEKMLTFKDGENKEVSVPEERKDQPVISDDQIRELSELAVGIEKHYGKPQDIEWTLERGKLYILQSRPVTGI